MKKLNNEQLTKLERLKDWTLVIVQYMDELSEPGSFIFKRVEETVHATYEMQDLRGMKVILNDLRQWVKGLPKAHIDIINKRLKAKFGQDLDSDATARKIKKIVESGVIKNLSAYKLLFEYFDEIYVDDSRKEETQKVNSMLEEYQQKIGKV